MWGMDPLRAAPGADIVLAAVAGEPGVHVVGGAVRDALLGKVPRELDLVVEGDAVPVAHRAAERVGGTLTVHERFGTATVRTDGFAFDLASARTESYPRPGALPEVELGATIAEDLARRDFTVNAMAVAVLDGARTDWPGAREDLRTACCACCTSARSSTTRRGCCGSSATPRGSASRRMPRHARCSIRALCDTVTGDRLGNELRLLLGEPSEAFRLLDALGPGPRAARRRLRARPGWPSAPPPGLLRLAACCTKIARGELAARLDHLGFLGSDRDVRWPRRAASSALHGSLDVERRRVVAPLAPRASSRRSSCWPRRASAAPSAGSTTSATAGWRSPATTWSRRG